MITLRLYQDGDHKAIADCIEPTVDGEAPSEEMLCGVILTALDDGKPVACGGISLTSEDEGYVWIRASRELQKTVLLRIIKEGHEIVKESFNLKRLFVLIQADFHKGQRLAERFGFKFIGFSGGFREYEKCLE